MTAKPTYRLLASGSSFRLGVRTRPKLRLHGTTENTVHWARVARLWHVGRLTAKSRRTRR